MCRKKTYGCFTSLIVLMAFFTSAIQVKAIGELRKEKAITAKTDTLGPIFRGLSLETDLAGSINGFLFGSKYASTDAALRANIYGKYFPVVEAGFAKSNEESISGINFESEAPYFRLGIDFNLMKNQKDVQAKQFFLVGARLGGSSFNYRLSGISITNDYWNENLLFNKDLQTTKIWYELSAGLRVKISKRLYAGWTVRNKKLISKDEAGSFKPMYIPGFGLNSESSWGFSYVLGYSF